MYGIIYYVLNVKDNKFYVGQTVESFKRRKQNHYNHVQVKGNNNYFHNALRKYKDWEWNVLQFAYCKAELDALEKYWVWILNSIAPNGYNLREGGSNGKHGTVARRNISEGLKGKKRKPFTRETRKNMSEARKGNTNGCGNKGKIVSKETRKRMSESRKGIKLSKEHKQNIGLAKKGNTYGHSKKGKYMGAEHPGAKAVQCIETGIVYGAIIEASRKTGICASSICLVANKSERQKTAGGCHWGFI